MSPYAPKKPCTTPRCPHLGDCPLHGRKKREQARPTATQRGYGYAWQQLSRQVRLEEPICRICGNHPSAVTDHIVPRSQGGTDDRENLQGACVPCHNRKTAVFDSPRPMMGDPIMTTVVCGPPGSGKTEYVRRRANWGDLIVDVDALYHALSGLPWYDKPDGLLPFVAEARDAVLARIKRGGAVRHAWVIMSGSDRSQREAWVQRGAQVVILAVGPSECWVRISADPRRRERAALWQTHIDMWWAEYQRTGGAMAGSGNVAEGGRISTASGHITARESRTPAVNPRFPKVECDDAPQA